MSENDKIQEEKNGADEASANDEKVEMVDATDDDANDQEVSDPEQQISKLTLDLAAEREKYLRALADLDNMRKRSRRDVEDARIMGQMNVLEETLPSLDSIDMALKSIEPTEANQAVYDGMLMVQRQFFTSMDKFALKRVVAVGEKFNPAVHEAVSYVPSPDHAAGAVMEEMRSGYQLGEKLLRASMVVVSSGPPAPVTPSADGDTSQGSESDASEADSDSMDDISNGRE